MLTVAALEIADAALAIAHAVVAAAVAVVAAALTIVVAVAGSALQQHFPNLLRVAKAVGS